MYSEANFWRDVRESDDRYERGVISQATHDSQIQQYLDWFKKTNKSKADKIRKLRGL